MIFFVRVILSIVESAMGGFCVLVGLIQINCQKSAGLYAVLGAACIDMPHAGQALYAVVLKPVP